MTRESPNADSERTCVLCGLSGTVTYVLSHDCPGRLEAGYGDQLQLPLWPDDDRPA